jgi:hypothetical protein
MLTIVNYRDYPFVATTFSAVADVQEAYRNAAHPEITRWSTRTDAVLTQYSGLPVSYQTEDSYQLVPANGEHEMDRRAIACFDQALADLELADKGLRQVLERIISPPWRQRFFNT